MVFYSPLRDELLIRYCGIGKTYFLNGQGILATPTEVAVHFGELTFIGEL